MEIEEKKRKLRASGKPQIVDDNNPIYLKKAIAIKIMKLFADLERKRMTGEDKAAARKEMRETWAKNWEESRQGRVDSWMTFKGKTPYGSKNTQKAKVEKLVEKKKKKF